MKQLFDRVLYGVIAAFLVLGVLFLSDRHYGAILFTGLVLLIIVAALYEFYQLAIAKGFSVLWRVGMLTTVSYVVCVAIAALHPDYSYLPMSALLAGLLFGFIYFFYNENRALSALSVTFFGIGYLAIPLSVFISINYLKLPHGEEGRFWILYVLLVTKMTDIGGYIAGNLFGRRSLAQEISPKKTLEGAIGGLLCSIITSFVFINIIFYKMVPAAIMMSSRQCLFLGASLGVLAQIGDLGESLLKRDAGVKNSSALPGLGGILDLVDSLIFTAPFIYLYLQSRGV